MLYSGCNADVADIDRLWDQLFISPKYVPVERMPPSSRACFTLSLNTSSVYRKFLKTKLPKEQYGFSIEKEVVDFVITDKLTTPEELLSDIR